MKKNLIFVLLLSLCALFAPQAHAQRAVNLEYPFGAIDNQGAITYASTVTITVKNSVTFASVAMTGDMVLAVTKTAGLRDGAYLYVLASSDGTARAVTGGTNVQQASVSGVINKSKLLTYRMFNGTFYLVTSNQVN